LISVAVTIPNAHPAELSRKASRSFVALAVAELTSEK
jgi:hypothetical protein